MSSLKFSIANNAVTHLGRNLYSTTPPALAELVANSYDAYATIVDITLSDDSISIHHECKDTRGRCPINQPNVLFLPRE